MSKTHTTHADIVNRLKRADGHLRRIVAMIEEGRPCVEVAQQLHAVEKAISQAKKTFVHDHIDYCLSGSVDHKRDARDLVREFKEISKYL
ncbi:metal-sensing transcriptional repressor [Prosthecochloris sp. SCSIO W1101]|uniref:metal-sensing transcriptional repressor n=1 Tax=Prosthecochloris sp. SCSIO W1101 TaxID=2992242 RepID=UPI00223E528B|nr:metal-sensing transcriptional repressor [Prosthecochloris sp. SCSIO W1101]UZJ40710.1 metal-sensing transcriptional repressor [Prosthecochloris sp. SCSIO W1101]